jgi:hypothetical protein
MRLGWGLAVLAGCVLAGWLAGSRPGLATAVVVGGLFVVALWSARGRLRRGPRLDLPRVPIAPELVLLPLAASVRQSPFVTIALVGVVAAVAALRSSDVPHQRLSVPLPLVALAGASAIVLSHAKITFVVVAGVVVVLYMVANIAGWLAGIQSPSASVRIGGYETSSGLFAKRILFPFTTSINEAASVAAVYTAILFLWWMSGRRLGRIHWVGIAAMLFVVVGANSRAPIAVALAVVLIASVAPIAGPRVLQVVAPVAMAVPFYLAVVQPMIDRGARLALSNEFLSRDQTFDDIAGLGTRGPIWSGTLDFWTSRPDAVHRLIGWGPNGHAASGANLFYVDGQDGFLSDPVALSTHNTLLQQLLDGGLIGLALLVGGIVLTISRHASHPTTRPLALAAVALAGCSVFEILLAPGATTTPFFLLLAFTAFADRPSGHKPQTREAVPSTRALSTP